MAGHVCPNMSIEGYHGDLYFEQSHSGEFEKKSRPKVATQPETPSTPKLNIGQTKPGRKPVAEKLLFFRSPGALGGMGQC